MKTVRVGVIGGGLMGREVASALGRWFALEDYPVRLELVAVCDLQETLLDWFRKVPTVRQLTREYAELLGNPEVDVVYVAVPHDLHLLRVEVAGTACALPLDLVLEIHAAVQLTPLPDAPEVVVGLMNRRGRALPVLDLRRRLGLPSRPIRSDDRLVVLSVPGREVALQVDAAVDVLTVPTSALDEAAAEEA
ncbi:MAG: chemotaxis protein CheW, partial [Gemmatimonadetes bacterium]|nr:chemotaxis protein CheW [Gemmatimonadota bacterium]